MDTAVSVRENVYSSRQMSGRPERRGDLLREQPDLMANGQTQWGQSE